MSDLYEKYYEEVLSQSPSQAMTKAAFRRAARKFKWNYGRFLSQLGRDASVLDFGCGVGQFLYYLKSSGFSNTIGLDVSKSQVERARSMLDDVDIVLVEDPITWLEQQCNNFDLVTMNDVLEHVDISKIPHLLEAVHASLRPGGLLLVKTVNGGYPLGTGGRYLDFTHTTAFTEKSLVQILIHAGFETVDCVQEEIGIYNIAFLMKKLVVYCIRGLLRVIVYFAEGGWPGIISLNLIAVARKE